jgi:glycosyltransferase involved in cell wall biosynthesis
MSARKILFLVHSECGTLEASLRAIEKCSRNGASPSVVALDFRAERELKKQGKACKTPRDYLTLHDTDAEAVQTATHLAKTWYVPFTKELSADGISLGEMVEGHCISLFIAAIRCAIIAHQLVTQEAPEELYVPRASMSAHPYAMAYAMLPRAVESFASEQGVQVTHIRPTMRARSNAAVALKTAFVSLAFSISATLFTWYAGIIGAYAKWRHGKLVILFQMCTPERKRIEEALGPGNVALPLYPLCVLKYMPKIFPIASRKLRSKFITLWGELRANELFKAELVYRDLPLFDILQPSFESLFRDIFPSLVAFNRWANANIRLRRPDVLVFMDDSYPVNRSLCNAAKRLGVSTLLVQHGAYADGMLIPAAPFCAHKQAVWGAISQDWHVERGKSRDSQVITGCHRFDAIAKGYFVDKGALCRRLDLDPEKRVIVFATSWYPNISVLYTPESQERRFASVLEAFKGFRDEQIVIKLHPGFHEQYEVMLAALAHDAGIRAVITHEHLWELLSVCDLLICDNSTVGLEAMILGKPVISVVDPTSPQLPYGRYGAAVIAHDAMDIASAIHALLNVTDVRRKVLDNGRRFVVEYAYIQDGHAAERIASLITQVARE